MVTSLRLAALAFVGCLSLAGCAADPVTRPETPVMDDDGEAPTRATPPSRATSGDGTLPVTPVQADDVTTTQDREAPAQGGESPAKPPKEGTTPATPAERIGSCTAQIEGHSSLATVTYTVVDGTVKVSKMTILVKNKDGRDQNDADVFLKPSGGGEQKLFWTGDKLLDGDSVELTDATKISAKTGATLRVETNFDKSLSSDPVASCTIVL